MKKKELVVYIFSFLISFISGLSLISAIYPNQNSETVFSPTTVKQNTTNTTVENSDTEPKTEPCPLNGKLYSKSQREKWEKRRPLGIMVENHKDARPQSGLQNADVIYEAVAEGGITRFLAIYLCEDASPVGPVRSARIYFIKILQGYGDHPLYAHVGGANTPGPADAIGYLEKIGWKLYNDLDNFAVPFPYYWRDFERLKNRATEHTMYTSTEKLWKFAALKRKLTDVDKKGTRWDENFKAWQFLDQEPEEGKTTEISYNFWGDAAGDYTVNWKYNSEEKLYERYQNTTPHRDKNSNKVLQFKNILVLFAKESKVDDGYEKGTHLLYDLEGTGDGLFFYNGNAIEGSWKKTEPEENFTFYDSKGKELKFPRGKFWISILPSYQNGKVKY